MVFRAAARRSSGEKRHPASRPAAPGSKVGGGVVPFEDHVDQFGQRVLAHAQLVEHLGVHGGPLRVGEMEVEVMEVDRQQL